MKENHLDQENHAIPNVVSSTPSDRKSVGNVQPSIRNRSERAITPTKLSPLPKQTSTIVRYDVWNNSATPRRTGRPRLAGLSACKPKDATSTPANAVSTSVGSVLSDNNSRTKRTRTPTQLSPLSKDNNNVQLSDTSRISLTLRPRGRRSMTDISTRTPFRDVTPIGSITFKSVISNGKDLDKTVGETSTKGKSIRDNRASRFMKQTPITYIDHGDPTFECSACGALLWYAESIRGATNASFDSYSLCCGRGKVSLTNEVDELPPLLKELITNKHPKSNNFIENIRRYNSMFTFTSMGGKQDTSINVGRGLYCYRMHGENCHLAGPLLSETGKPAKFAQLYIFDTENEIQNRIAIVINGEGSSSSRHNKLDYKLTTDIRDLLDEINPLVKDFRMAGERIRSSDDQKISLRLIGTRPRDGRQYNLPTKSEVATLIVGDFDSTEHKRDIILQCQDGDFKRISELHPSYLTLHYPLFFPYGKDNYRTDIFHEGAKRGLNSEDRPDIISRVFKIKLDCLMKELKDDHTFGRVEGVVYTIEFQKRGLPHCHILLWIEPQDKLTTTGKIDNYISAEILNKDEDPELYQLVTNHIMHGLCGAENPSCPCTVDYKCTKKFPKQFNESTVIEDSGYGIYKRRNDGATIKKSETNLHNGYVVPYNPGLLRRYQAHINVEYCNQVGSIKYLFKYINKGPDRVTATIDGEEVDEIKDYLNCRYLSSCKAAWRIYGFDIHYRTPSVERLLFHLKHEQQVIFVMTESINYAVDKSSINETKFESWIQQNQTDTFVRSLLYVEIPRYFVWNQKQRVWTQRKQDSMSRPEVVWEKTWSVMVADVLNVERIKQGIPDLELSDIQRKNICLTYIECMLRSNNKSLKDIQNMSLTTEQKGIYSTVMNVVDNNKGGMFFVYGYGGTGKTYLYKTMHAALLSKGEIVLNVASSGIAALLLEGGRTAHSQFAIPINVVEDSMCHIGADNDLADLIRRAKLIIWDEAPMINRHCYEAFDLTLRDICRTDPSVVSDKVFGGKVVLFGGDFRQILPVITNGDIGNGKAGGANDGQSTVVFPDDMLIQETDDDVGAIIDDTYPDLLRNLWNPSFFQEKSILAPTHEMVDIINQRMLTMLIGDEKEYESLDSVCLVDEDSNFDDSIYTTEFLNGLRMSGMPHHSIKLKIGTPIMLMCNIDQKVGLCNGTRLQVLRLGNNITEAKIISSGSVGKICAIPRMVISPTDTKMPFKLNRRQFPIQVCFAMTINKSQGHTLSQVRRTINTFE
ncbi:DNA helicase PIF1, ATP-dependent [Tanacetum coccineum]|uniref:ATP-dependent DNA helicase n=1 Tax=Tanacetum coccineum TaxID=301880 RepID=A0ABQ5J4U0_9ASTR